MTEEMTEALKNWRVFNTLLSHIPEKEVKEMLVYEIKHKKRKSFISRLHQRYNTLKTMREREELMDKFKE